MLSGGLDSATCLYWARNRFRNISAITFNYFGRLEAEKRSTRRLAKNAGTARLIEVDVPFVKEASDFYNGRFRKSGADREGLLSSYVPARNMIFYSIAAHYAEFLDIRWIVGGHNRDDVQFFRDSSERYVQKINELFEEGCQLCDGHAYRILLPLAGMQRKEIVKLAIRLKTPVEMTWSCHTAGKIHCGRCYACKQRIDAFRALGLTDPAFKSS
jgi:7-cyano-7-deazaguanine synthase